MYTLKVYFYAVYAFIFADLIYFAMRLPAAATITADFLSSRCRSCLMPAMFTYVYLITLMLLYALASPYAAVTLLLRCRHC